MSEGIPVPNGQAITTHAEAITTQANGEVTPRENKHACNMDCRLRDSTRMNPPMFFGSIVYEDPHDFIDEVCKILFSTGVNTSEKAKLSSIN